MLTFRVWSRKLSFNYDLFEQRIWSNQNRLNNIRQYFSMRAYFFDVFSYILYLGVVHFYMTENSHSLPYWLIEFLRVHKFEIVHGWTMATWNHTMYQVRSYVVGAIPWCILFVCSFPLVFQVIYQSLFSPCNSPSVEQQQQSSKKKNTL